MYRTATYKDVFDILERYDSFVIVGHYSPDADCISSTLAMHLLLAKMGKRSVPANSDAFPRKLRKIPHIDEVAFQYDVNALPLKGVLIAVDAGDIARIGHLNEYLHHFDEVVLIDHHILRTEGMTVALVDETSASTTEVIFQMIEACAPTLLDAEIALQLHLGLVADTGSFCFQNTTPLTLRIAAKLLEAGVDVVEVDGILNRVMEPSDYRVLEVIFAEMKAELDDRFVYVTHRQNAGGKVYNDVNVSPIAQIMQLDKTIVGLVIRESGDIWRGSLRSRGKVDVRKIAELLGGGGHIKAAGFEAPKAKYSPEDIVAIVRAKLKTQFVELYGA